MVTSLFSVLVAASLSMVAHAQVYPFAPAGDTYTTGQTCHIAWTGDKNSTTAWKDMAIELMVGSNLEMVHLTTVATGQDGTVDGTFDHVCPDVTVNAPIFFYQFTAPAAGVSATTWTTRFTIKGADGHLDPAPNAKQPPPGNEPIPWGVAALKDPSTASAAPTFAPDAGSATPSGTVVGATTTPPPTSQSQSQSQSQSTSTTSSSSKLLTTTSSSTTSTATPTTNSTNNTKDSGAVAVKLDSRLLHVATVLAASAMGFSILL